MCTDATNMPLTEFRTVSRSHCVPETFRTVTRAPYRNRTVPLNEFRTLNRIHFVPQMFLTVNRIHKSVPLIEFRTTIVPYHNRSVPLPEFCTATVPYH